VPVGLLPPLTVAVKVTDCPTNDGLSDETTAVVVTAGPLALTLKRTMWLPLFSVIQRLPSGPVVIIILSLAPI
jgi:hypothetical protein